MKNKRFILHLPIAVFALGLVIMAAAAAENADTQLTAEGRSCYRLIPQEVYSGPPGKPPSPDNKHPVCKVLLENLNEFCNEEPPNMVCEFKIHPRYRNQLSIPKWTKLDIYKNLDKIEAMIRAPLEIEAITARNKSYQDKVWQEYYTDLKKGLDNRTATLHRAKIDLYNLGKAYEVLRVEHGKCMGNRIILAPTDDPKVAAFEFQQSWVDIDYSASALKQVLDPSMVKISTMKGDVFFFRGKTFSYKWYRNELWILQPFKDPEANGNFNTKEICWFEYIKY